MKKYTIGEIALIILYRTSNPMLFCCEVHGILHNTLKYIMLYFAKIVFINTKKIKVISHILDLSKLKLEVHMKRN